MISVQYYECYCTLLRGATFSGHTVVFRLPNIFAKVRQVWGYWIQVGIQISQLSVKSAVQWRCNQWFHKCFVPVRNYPFHVKFMLSGRSHRHRVPCAPPKWKLTVTLCARLTRDVSAIAEVLVETDWEPWSTLSYTIETATTILSTQSAASQSVIKPR